MATNPTVDAWMASYDNPMKDVVQRVREILLEADPRLEESVKWQAPTFSYRGNLASFFPRSKAHASLMFHTGATLPGEFPSLEGDGKEARSMKISSLDDAESKRGELTAIVAAWMSSRDGA